MKTDQSGGLHLNYSASSTILHNLGFQLDEDILNLLKVSLSKKELIIKDNIEFHTRVRSYIKHFGPTKYGEENSIPIIVYRPIPIRDIEPQFIYSQPTFETTYNYILLELLLKRLFVDLNKIESKLLVGTLNQFHKVYLIDVGNIGHKYKEVFTFLISRCDREYIGDHPKNLYLFFDKNPNNQSIEVENFETAFMKYIQQHIKRITLDEAKDEAKKYRNNQGKNMIMIRSYAIYKSDQVLTSNAMDDFIFWLFAIAINNIFDNNLDSRDFRTNLVLISNDKQKINDPNGGKNLYTELSKVDNFIIYINGVHNILVTEIAKNISKNIINACVSPASCVPSKYRPEEIGIENAKSCVYAYDKERFWRDDMVTDIDNVILKTLTIVVKNINEQIGNPCNLFEKFMTLIRYLQYIYFNCAETIEEEKSNKTKKPKKSKTPKKEYDTKLHPLPSINKDKCAMSIIEKDQFFLGLY